MNPFKDFVDKAATNIGKAANDAAEAAKDAITHAPENIGKAASGAADAIGSAISQAPETLSSAASTAADTIGSATSTAVSAIGSAASAAPEVIGTAVNAAGNVATDAVNAVGKGVEAVYDNTIGARLKRERINGFKDGINQGAYLAGQVRYNYYYAYIATLCYFLRQSGNLTEEEEQWLKDGLEHLKLEGGVPDDVREKMFEIALNEELSFDDVSNYLDNVSLVSLDSIVESTETAIELDGIVSNEEIAAREKLSEYVNARVSEGCDECDSWSQRAIADSVAEYSDNYDKVQQEFREKTQLQDKDIAFLLGATMLQVARVLVINALTEVEAANKGKKEAALHKAQDKIFKDNKLFKKAAQEERTLDTDSYAPLSQIIGTPGVPYDINIQEKSLKEQLQKAGQKGGIFEGGDHRFSTLGHDPALGLIFGTSNIMTNTITISKGLGRSPRGIPFTYQVDYKTYAKPTITSKNVGTINTLVRSAKRIREEPEAAAASLIKQLIHIGTDLYTPCGIQIPFANLALDPAHTEKLTRYISTGDILKVGAQAGMTVLINWLIASLHGCSLIFKDDGEDFSVEAYQIRTKKILLISETIAASSSVIQAAITSNPKCLDLGGAAVLLYRLFTDIKFISKVKEDYINSGLGSIYEERAKGILY